MSSVPRAAEVPPSAPLTAGAPAPTPTPGSLPAGALVPAPDSLPARASSRLVPGRPATSITPMTEASATSTTGNGTGSDERDARSPGSALIGRHELAGSPDVVGHGPGELLDGLEALLVAEPGPELDRHLLPDQVAIEVQQVSLDVERLGPERRIGAHVDRGRTLEPVDARPPGVDASAGQEQPRPGAEVGGRVPQPLPPSRALDDPAVQHEPASERPARPLQVSPGERLADGGRGHPAPVDLEQLDALRGEPPRRPLLDQPVDGPPRPVAER